MLIKKFHAKSEISSRRRRERPLPLLSPLRANPIPQRQHTPIRVFNSFHGHCEHAHWNYFIRVFHRLRELTSLLFERTIPRPFKRFHKGSLSLYLYLYLPSSTFSVHLISSSRYIVRSRIPNCTNGGQRLSNKFRKRQNRRDRSLPLSSFRQGVYRNKKYVDVRVQTE